MKPRRSPMHSSRKTPWASLPPSTTTKVAKSIPLARCNTRHQGDGNPFASVSGFLFISKLLLNFLYSNLFHFSTFLVRKATLFVHTKNRLWPVFSWGKSKCGAFTWGDSNSGAIPALVKAGRELVPSLKFSVEKILRRRRDSPLAHHLKKRHKAVFYFIPPYSSPPSHQKNPLYSERLAQPCHSWHSLVRTQYVESKQHYLNPLDLL